MTPAPRTDSSGDLTLECTLSPSGHLHLQPDPAGAGPPLAPAVARRIGRAFEAGRGPGLLHLGVAEVGTELPPSLAYWRDFAQAFVARACGALDPTEPGAAAMPDATPEELAAFAEAVPPMQGAEAISAELLGELWRELGERLGREAKRAEGGVQGYLRRQSPVWHVVGRVCFHLAENRADPDYPFAFLATYVSRVSRHARPQHRPLGQALEEYAGARDRQKLLALLSPLSRAAEESELLRELVDSGDVYHPLSWTPREAHRFLGEVALYERCGLVVRTPDWWSAARRPRPRVTVSLGGEAPSELGMDALLDFDVRLSLEGEPLTAREIQALLSSSDGLVSIRGRWVEVDPARLAGVLQHWRELEQQAAEGISFREAMRLLAGAPPDGDDAEAALAGERPEWSDVVAGKWLSSRLEALRSPALRSEIDAGAGLSAELRPYQKTGVQWLWTLRGMELGGCLADDMGLGKTIQVLGVLSLSRRRKEEGTDLLVVPASLLDNWRSEAERFAPRLRVLIAHPSRLPGPELRALSAEKLERYDAVVTSYATLERTEWMKRHAWRSVILDEAQAIKNPAARQTQAVKALDCRWRLALTGTPVENRLGDLWSIFDFLNPGLLGSARSFKKLCRSMASHERGYAPLRRLVQPYLLRRLKTDRSVIQDLPDKTEVDAWCLLSRRQAALYARAVEEMKESLGRLDGIQRRGAVLALLLRLKQICNHPSQWLGDGGFEPGASGKLLRLRELCEPLAQRQDKVLVFTQFREMTGPLAGFLGDVFGRAGLVLHGGTPVRKRPALVRRFQEDDAVPFMVLSLKAGGTGLNLTAASHVIHFDRWWNPAVENQATDRAFRIGQKRNVLVHRFVCRGTVEERIAAMIAGKQKLSDQVLQAGAETALTELSDAELMRMVSLDLTSAVEG
jgi:non-specific serine/threonine protein kinase